MPNKFLILFTVASALLLSACTQPAENPKAIAEKYWQSLQTGNIKAAEKLVSISSRNAFSKHQEYIDSNTRISNSNARTVVSTTITKIDSESGEPYTNTIETVLVLEQGQWKVDVEQSPLPVPAVSKQEELQQLAEDLSESMHENIDSIDEAMSHGMQMLDEALQEGSKEMSQSLLNLMNELNRGMQESIEKMKKRRQHQLDEQKQDRHKKTVPQPDPHQGEGMI